MVQQERMDDEGVVVVEAEFRAVGVLTVADVPLLHLTDRIVDAHGIGAPDRSGAGTPRPSRGNSSQLL
jgi:hypothetical protein